jgi:hypothetical protein
LCESLYYARLPQSIAIIPHDMFADTDLTEIVIPEGVVEIESVVFSRCGSLKAVTLPGTIKKIGAGAFKDCASLSVINIPDSVKSIVFESSSISPDVFGGVAGSMSLATQGLLRRLGYKGNF